MRFSSHTQVGKFFFFFFFGLAFVNLHLEGLLWFCTLSFCLFFAFCGEGDFQNGIYDFSSLKNSS